jgi:amidase
MSKMNRSSNLVNLDAVAQAEMVKMKEIEPAELVEGAIERIEKLNPKINAVINPLFEQARDQVANLPEGKFTGVPTLLKDSTRVKGVSTTSGATLLKGNISDQDSEIVKKMRESGLVFLGITNMPEFGILCTTEPRLYGPTHNPWDLSRTPGGSSGGASAAVASSMVAMAQGGDGGGSIRIPSSCCGLFGMKLSRGRESVDLHMSEIGARLVSHHVLTKSVRDSAAMIDVTLGPTPGQLYSQPPPVRPFIEEVGESPGVLKIAFTDESFRGGQVHSDCVKAVHDAADLCSELGHIIDNTSPVLNSKLYGEAFLTLWSLNNYARIINISRNRGQKIEKELMEPVTWAMYDRGRQYGVVDYFQAMQVLQETTCSFAKFLSDYEVFLTPTLAEPPVPLGTFDATYDDPMRGFDRALSFTPFTSVANATGSPAMSMPLYWNNRGLPIGSQFIGRYGDEATLIRLASQIEIARPWNQHRPPI